MPCLFRSKHSFQSSIRTCNSPSVCRYHIDRQTEPSRSLRVRLHPTDNRIRDPQRHGFTPTQSTCRKHAYKHVKGQPLGFSLPSRCTNPAKVRYLLPRRCEDNASNVFPSIFRQPSPQPISKDAAFSQSISRTRHRVGAGCSPAAFHLHLPPPHPLQSNPPLRNTASRLGSQVIKGGASKRSTLCSHTETLPGLACTYLGGQ